MILFRLLDMLVNSGSIVLQLLLYTQPTGNDMMDPDLLRKVKFFSSKFVSVFMTKLQNYEREAGGEESGKAGANAELFSDIAVSAISGASRYVQLAFAGPVLGKVCSATARTISGLLKRITTGIGGEEHRRKARKVTGVMSNFDDSFLRQELCKAGINIFLLFKETLGKEFRSEGSSKVFLSLCVIEATDRIFDYLYSLKEVPDETIIQLCIQGLWKGKSKSLAKTLGVRNREYQIAFASLTKSTPLPSNFESALGMSAINVETLSKEIFPDKQDETDHLKSDMQEIKEVIFQFEHLLKRSSCTSLDCL